MKNNVKIMGYITTAARSETVNGQEFWRFSILSNLTKRAALVGACIIEIATKPVSGVIITALQYGVQVDITGAIVSRDLNPRQQYILASSLKIVTSSGGSEDTDDDEE